MKTPILLIALSAFIFLSWCAETLDKINESVDTVRESEHYQQVKQGVTSWVKYIWEKTNEFIENNTWAQKALDTANQVLDRATEEAIKFWEQAQESAKEIWERAEEEARKQYEQLKEETKAKVDEAFDKI